MAMSFKYQPLDPERQEIRLVELDPDTTPSHIKLTTRHATLSEPPRYYTLSYTWGAPYEGLSAEWDDPSCTRTISLDGEKFEVRWNLHAALTAFCATPTKYPTMWIDAICIDQSNIQERNTQVPLMGQIYTKAETTFAWLGPESERFAGVKDAIHTNTQPCDDRFERFRAQSPHDYLLRLAQLLRCTWFGRMWVAQEIALSREVILLVGKEIVASWDSLKEMLALCYQYEALLATDQNLQDNERRLLELLFKVSGVSNYFQRSNKLRKMVQQNIDLSLRMVLGILQPLIASDARDKVYGALGLPLKHNIVEIDYNSSVSDVFITTTRGWLENTGDVRILALCQPSDIPNFPSWAVDLANPKVSLVQGPFYVLESTKPLYSAGGFGPARLQFENPRTLIVSGCSLSTLSFIGSRSAWEHFSGLSEKTMENWLANGHRPEAPWHFPSLQQAWLKERNIQHSATDGFPDRYPWTQEKILKAIVRTLLADAKVDYAGKTERLKEVVGWPGDHPSGADKWTMTMLLTSYNFAITSKQHFCLVRDDVQVGDVVVVAIGAETPYVLRPNGDGTYNFRGFCYVHGFMDGELFKPGELSANGEEVTIEELRIV